jgi:hypothetical protein
MEPKPPTRMLVVTDRAQPAQSLMQATRERADTDDVRFPVVVPNPAHAAPLASSPRAGFFVNGGL